MRAGGAAAAASVRGRSDAGNEIRRAGQAHAGPGPPAAVVQKRCVRRGIIAR